MAHGGVRLDTREDRLNDPHVRPLMELVRYLRSRGLDVPNVDPNDGGVNAQVLILLETPGPKAVASRFVSRDNSAVALGFNAHATVEPNAARKTLSSYKNHTKITLQICKKRYASLRPHMRGLQSCKRQRPLAACESSLMRAGFVIGLIRFRSECAESRHSSHCR